MPEINPPSDTRITWTVDDSGFDSYVNLVRFPSGAARECIEYKIGKSATNTVLDLAGGTHGRAVADLIESGYVGNGIYTNLVNSRTIESDPRIQLITGDLRDDVTWDKILQAQIDLCSDGLDLVLHRPYGALQDLTTDEYLDFATRVLNLIKPGGIFYTQVPTSYVHDERNDGLIKVLHRTISKLPEVEKIECSDHTTALADLDFCIIYKH